MIYSLTALQTFVEISEIPTQSPVGKPGGEVLHCLMKPDIFKLLLQPLLSL